MAWELAFYRPVRDLVAWIWRHFQKPDPEETLRSRAKWKAEFEAHLTQHLKNNDVIIRDVVRMDNYPDLSESEKGISSWFKLEFKSLYHRGFEAFMGVDSLRHVEETDCWVSCHHNHPNAVNALRVARIPYDAVKTVDWSGDEYYSCPHIYCDFTKRRRKEPYEEILYYTARESGGRDVFEELVRYDDVLKSSDARGANDA